MIDRVVLVTGAMRSGVSLVASMCHRLGFPVTSLLDAPIPPRFRSDWQDPRLTLRLMAREVIDWAEYLAQRRRESVALGFDGRVAISSQYLAVYWADVRKAIPDAFVIKTYRGHDDMAASMRAHPQISEADQELICRALHDVKADCSLGYEFVCENPQTAAEMLARHLGNADPVAVAAAAALVGKSTTYAPVDPSRDRPLLEQGRR